MRAYRYFLTFLIGVLVGVVIMGIAAVYYESKPQLEPVKPIGTEVTHPINTFSDLHKCSGAEWRMSHI